MILTLVIFAVIIACTAQVQGQKCFDLDEAHKNLVPIHDACQKASTGAGGDKTVCYNKYRECCLTQLKAWDDGSKCVDHDKFVEVLQKYADDELKGKLATDVASCKDKCSSSGTGDKLNDYYDCLEEKLSKDCAGISGFRQKFRQEFHTAAEEICK